MAANKKPRKAYKPKGVLQDPVSHVLSGFKPLVSLGGANTTLRTEYHLPLEMLMTGRATAHDVDRLVSASNVAMAFKSNGFGVEYADVARAGADAVEALYNRERKVCTGPELNAIKRMIELLDAQLDIARVKDFLTAVKLAARKEREGVAV